MKILITGGTLDKQYNPLNGELIFNQSSLADMLAQSRSTVETELEILMLKDSLEMKDDDRQVLSSACNACEQTQIIITHGTDTMVESAQAIAAQLSPSKTVVLLGAMVPYQFKGSDALYNLGCAMSAVQVLPAGVYITMNGQVFDYREVKKNRAIGQFVKQP
ncbi:MAG: asparaginase domain-containing protein [Oleispira sp.]